MVTGFMRSCFKIILALALVVLILPSAPVMATDFPLSTDDTAITDALDYLRQAQAADGNIGGFAISAWVVMALVAAGEDPHDWGDPSIIDYLRDNWGNLDWDKATDVERSILAITAAGEDPTDFGGQDYLTQLKSLYDGEQVGYDDTLNDDFWGILALIAAGESPSSDIIVNTCEFIKYWQNEDGGWNWLAGDDSDVDDTGAAIMALIAAGESPDSDAVMMGLMFLMDTQNSDGGFPWMWGGASTSASCTWAIGALVAAGEAPATWEMGSGDDNPISCLLSLQDTDGAFKYTASQKTSPEFMTAYAIPALLGDPYPVTAIDWQLPPPEEPDLTVTDVYVPATIYTDVATTIIARISNIGDQDITDSFTVRLKVNSTTVATTTVTALAAGGSIDVSLVWRPTAAGNYTLKVIADSASSINESNEDNNEYSTQAEVGDQPQPDLTVTDIDVPTAIYTDVATTVTATIANSGDEDIADGFKIKLKANGATIDTAIIAALDAGGSVSADLEWTPATSGDYTLKVTADSSYDIDESNENNNRETIEVEVTEQPEGTDLVVTDTDLPDSIYIDAAATITATISNVGDDDISDNFEVKLKVNGATIDTITITALDAGGIVSADLEWTPATSGDYTLKVTADSGDAIDESSENNNEYSVQAEVNEQPQPDLTVTDIAAPAVIYTDAATTITATINNIGNQDITGNFKVRLNANGTPVDTITITALDAGGSVSADFEWTPATSGDYTLKVTADSGDAIDESSESNNESVFEPRVANVSSDSSQEESSPAVSPVISANIEPGNIDFGDLTPGETSAEFEITIANTGGRDMLVTADLAGNAQDFYADTLRLNSWPWDVFKLVVPRQSSRIIRASLSVPQSYSGQIMEGGILIFWSTVAP